jgi:hypothetical protein
VSRRRAGTARCSDMRLLTASALSLAALAGAAPASAAAFDEPRTLSDWGPGGEVLARR